MDTKSVMSEFNTTVLVMTIAFLFSTVFCCITFTKVLLLYNTFEFHPQLYFLGWCATSGWVSIWSCDHYFPSCHNLERSRVKHMLMYSLVQKPREVAAYQLHNMFSKKTLCFVTGASRGLGESIAVNFASKLPTGSVIFLLARSEGDLEKVKNRLLEKSPHVTTVSRRFDQSSQDQQVFEAVFSQALESAGVKADDFQQAILVNNAGSLKPVVYTRNLPGVQELSQYLNTNVSGVIALTSQFLKSFPASSGVIRVVINISSLAAVQPFKSWAMYSSAKAARDMFFKVVAAEEEDVRVLSYAPGPLVTDMLDKLIDSEDEGVRNWAKNAKAEKTLLPCDTSVAKLIQILEKNSFVSGAHVDYYDEI